LNHVDVVTLYACAVIVAVWYTLQSLSYLLKTIKQKLRESRQSQTWSESYERADNHKHGVKVTREQTITNME